MSKFHHIKTIAEVHSIFGLEKPLHPLITLIKKWPQTNLDFSEIKITSDLYLLSMKGKIKGTTFQYGRNSYDFEEGTLVFLAPNQVASFSDPIEELDDSGWTILFHPDLIRKAELGNTIKSFSFFDYETNEALHLSEKEKISLRELVGKIELELNQNIDKHSQELIIQNLETILKYSDRYYDRQFYTRTNIHIEIVNRFEKYLKEYLTSENLKNEGLPTVAKSGKALNMSGSYLSDLLKQETGRSAKEHIHVHIIEKAKSMLLGSDKNMGEIAHNLGFEYSQHFSKFFKSKTGTSPSSYRDIN